LSSEREEQLTWMHPPKGGVRVPIFVPQLEYTSDPAFSNEESQPCSESGRSKKIKIEGAVQRER
jgi:hypothetical protein